MTRQELIERIAQAIAEKEGFYLTEPKPTGGASAIDRVRSETPIRGMSAPGAMRAGSGIRSMAVTSTSSLGHRRVFQASLVMP